MLERGRQTSPKNDRKRNSTFVNLSFGIEAINNYCLGIGHPANASQKTVPYRGGIVGLEEPHKRAKPRGSPAPLTLSRLGFLMRILPTALALGNYRLINTKNRGSPL